MSALQQLLAGGDPVRSALYALQGAPIGASHVRQTALAQLTAPQPGGFEPLARGLPVQFGVTQRRADEIERAAFDTAMNFAGTTPLKRGAFSLDYYGTPVKVLQNPGNAELSGFLGRTKYKAARRLVDPKTGDVFVWDANDPALHRMVAEQLGVPWERNIIADMIGLD